MNSANDSMAYTIRFPKCGHTTVRMMKPRVCGVRWVEGVTIDSNLHAFCPECLEKDIRASLPALLNLVANAINA